MKSVLINNGELKTYALVFDNRDDVMPALQEFATNAKLKASQFTAIGAFSKVQIGYFDIAVKDYKKIDVDEQVEVLTLNGDITLFEGKPKIHAHVVLGRSDGSVAGGHLLQATVNPTLEIILNESPGYLERRIDKETGLPLIYLQPSAGNP
jgi:uncharacterized protein